MRLRTLLFVLLFSTAPSLIFAQETPADLFKKQEKAIRKGKQETFKETWAVNSYRTNYVGGSGLSGIAFYTQASREKWYLKPGNSEVTKQDTAVNWMIFQCEVWSWKRKAAVDAVYALIVLTPDKNWLMLGTGENKGQVEALRKRFEAGGDLEPVR